jgi:hypothetical protein
MRLRRAVPKIPPKSSVPPRLPFHKSRLLLTRPESTLPQLLIPLHFNSRRCNAYKKPGEGVPLSSPKVLQLVTPSFTCHSESSTYPCASERAARGDLCTSERFPRGESAFSHFRLCLVTSLPHYVVTSHFFDSAHAGTPATPVPSIVYFATRGYPGGGYALRKKAFLSTPCLSRVAKGSPSVVSVLFLPPVASHQSLHPLRSPCSQTCRPIVRAECLKQFPDTPRLLCKNRSLNDPDTSPGRPHLPRGVL